MKTGIGGVSEGRVKYKDRWSVRRREKDKEIKEVFRTHSVTHKSIKLAKEST